MVSWTSDGLVSGYDAITQQWKRENFHLNFSTPGSVVDLASLPGGGVTRLGNRLQDTAYTNALTGRSHLTVTAADVTNNGLYLGYKWVTVGMYAAKASAFAPGVTPTPQQIMDNAWFSSVSGENAAVSAGNWTLNNFVGRSSTDSSPVLQWPSDTKFWVALIPLLYTAVMGGGYTLSPLSGTTVNTIGRGISIWTNRDPEQPVLSTSSNEVTPGSTFTISLDSTNDPDTLPIPDDSARANRDLAGVEFQYAPVPTELNPTPAWSPLEFYAPTGPSTSSWGIKGTNGTTFDFLRLDSALTVLAGADYPLIPYPSKTALLASGKWQIRARTFDYKHPYPLVAYPLGGDPALGPGITSPDSYEGNGASPWSEPVRVTILSQVPPPVPLDPKDNRAVPFDGSTTLSWLYRSAHVPMYPQDRRRVQIRKVGETDWNTIADGFSPEKSLDLPVVSGNPGGEHEYFTDPGFENGTTDVWDWRFVKSGGAPPSPSPTITNQTSAPNSHSGTHYARLYGADETGYTYWEAEFLLRPEDTQFQATGFLYPDNEIDHIEITLDWLDEDGDILPLPGTDPSVAYVIFDKATGTSWSTPYPGGWIPFATGTETEPDVFVPRPTGAVSVRLSISGTGISIVGNQDYRLDDVSLIGISEPTVPYALENSTHYEWRVQAWDTDGEESNYSEPALFWTVPLPASGDVRPPSTSEIDGATLGCGTHRVQVFRRGGTRLVGEITGISHLDWDRKRDDISTAQIVVSDWGIDCGNLLASLQTWAYELVITRNNGFSEDRVWEGPITLITYEYDKVTIDAKDVMGYAYRRILKQRMSDPFRTGVVGTTVVDRARRCIQNGFAPDDPNVLANLQVIERDDDAKQYRTTAAFSRTVFEEVDDMAANAGLDYTVVGRSIILWGTKHRIGTLPEFRDQDLGAHPVVSEYGMSMANVYSVSDGNGVYGVATRGGLTWGADTVSGNDETYGLVEMLSSTWASDSTEDSGTYTQAGRAKMVESFTEYAERSINDRYGPPVIVRIPDNTTLNPNTVLSIQQLVPGVVIPLRSTSTLREVVGSQKLDSVKVVEEAGKETISITLSAFSRDDVEAGGEE